MGVFDDEGTTSFKAKQPVEDDEGKEVFFTDKQIEEELQRKPEQGSRTCCLIYGQEGSGKSGLALSYLKKMKDDERMIIVDLDGGVLPLLESCWKDEFVKGKVLWVNPLELTKDDVKKQIVLDYKKTFTKIKAMVLWVKNNYKGKNIRAVVFDGLSTALNYAESQMRIERNLTPDGGVNMAFWKIRNKYFTEILETIKSLPVARIFISHEDFIEDLIASPDRKISVVKQKTNQMMWQKIRTSRTDINGTVEYTYVIDKSKYKAVAEGKSSIFLSVEGDKFNWTGEKVWGLLE